MTVKSTARARKKAAPGVPDNLRAGTGAAPELVQLLTPEGDAATYTFNKHVIRHRFCPMCGIHPYADGKDRSGAPIAAINIRCLEDFDIEKIPVKQVNGKAF